MPSPGEKSPAGTPRASECSRGNAQASQGLCAECTQQPEPLYVPFLIVDSIFIAFIILGSLAAIYCCTCLRPKEPSQQPIRFSLRSYQIEILPMILTSTSLRTLSRQSSTATSSSSTGGSILRVSFARMEPNCLVLSPPPPYTTGHPIHLTQPSGFLVSPQYFTYRLQQEPPQPGKNCPDFSSS
ncbi:protein shisa-3 homolog [Oryctolagus cuniculus]|uniref:protein shisa-3 homolog n=1 Tax=Oryctolagus cuniculus TaxID=9986 RepID=UPI00387971FE